MLTANLKVTAKNPSNKQINTTISYANPNVSNQLLSQLAIKLNDLTLNTIVKITKTMEETL